MQAILDYQKDAGSTNMPHKSFNLLRPTLSNISDALAQCSVEETMAEEDTTAFRVFRDMSGVVIEENV